MKRGLVLVGVVVSLLVGVGLAVTSCSNNSSNGNSHQFKGTAVLKKF
jgi:hypothetical protein